MSQTFAEFFFLLLLFVCFAIWDSLFALFPLCQQRRDSECSACLAHHSQTRFILDKRQPTTKTNDTRKKNGGEEWRTQFYIGLVERETKGIVHTPSFLAQRTTQNNNNNRKKNIFWEKELCKTQRAHETNRKETHKKVPIKGQEVNFYL